MLWVVTLLYGLCMASIYALIFSFPFQLGLTITGRTSSIFIGASSSLFSLFSLVHSRSPQQDS